MTRLASTQPPLVMHVLHHLVIGGMENGLVNMVNRLPHDQWRHRVLCVEDYSDFRGRIERPDVEVIALRRSAVGAWGVRRQVFAECRRYRPAIVHTRALSGLDALAPAWLAGGARIVHSEHGWDMDDVGGFRRKPALLRRANAMWVDRFLAVSEDLRRYLIDRVKVSPSLVERIYNGVDLNRFAPRSGDARPALPAGFAPPQAVVVGTVGRLQAVKDQATLLRAMARLRQRRADLSPRLRVVLVGGGPLEGALRQEAAALGLADAAWFTGSVEDVPAVLRCLDVFVLPSLMEGTSNTLLEAMACALPVLATPVGGNRELLRPGLVGEFFACRGEDQLATLIEKYADQPELMQRQGHAARQLVQQEYSLDTMVSRYGALYRSLLESKKS